MKWPPDKPNAVQIHLLHCILEWFDHSTKIETPSQPDLHNYHLAQNYPNPFNPSTQICFSMPCAGMVKLEIFNYLGQLVCELMHRELPGGEHSVIWNGTNAAGNSVPSGLYYCRLSAGKFVDSRKIILLK